jgi:hypothetical protein
LKKHKAWFDEGCSKLLDQRKEAKLQWLQDPSEINWDNLDNLRHEAIRYFKNENREYLDGSHLSKTCDMYNVNYIKFLTMD